MNAEYYHKVKQYLNNIFYIKVNFINIIFILIILFSLINILQYRIYSNLHSYERYIYINDSDLKYDKQLIPLNNEEELRMYFVQSYCRNLFSYNLKNIEQNYIYVNNLTEEGSNAYQYIEDIFEQSLKAIDNNIIIQEYQLQELIPINNNQYQVVFFTTFYNQKYEKINYKFTIELSFDISYKDDFIFKMINIKNI